MEPCCLRFGSVGMNIDQMRQAAHMGAYLEFVYNALIGPAKLSTFRNMRERFVQWGQSIASCRATWARREILYIRMVCWRSSRRCVVKPSR